ncbi:vascular endothelial growth factor receptor 1-like isoform X1 [Neodiprion virginianus]|uniref:vascular endothelial growth factor receptor 1-like isoform X1 n=2 Tax=Neodiprion virginianus TaxID=2961670 RepID=UPI001EE6E23B|nr:vascular endothelial growth factor receptor 1-like isoform X1 [Neodiprion virginianus]
MDWISLTCVVVFIVLGQREGVAARKPTISSNAKDGMIQEGNELRIFCKGDGKLHFSVMEVPSDKGSCNHTINYGPNKASFVCHNATRSDTRWYACAKEGIVIRNTDLTIEHPDEDIAWIHIYVNSTEPFAQMAIGRELSVTETGPVVFPCRTTSPHWEVLLHTTNENLTGRFDPKIGFIATGDLSYLVNQEINCSVINEPRALRDMKSVSYRLADEEDDLPMPKPEIDKIALHHMVWGRDQNINCTITVPLKNLTLQWKAPESVHHQRLITTRFTTDTADPMYTSYISELTIKNVTENDGGSYTCFIQEYSDVDEAADTCDIKFWDPNHFFVNVSMVEGDDYRSIVGKEGETYRWNIKVDAYPEYSLHWYKIDHQELKEINFNNNSKYSVSDPFRTDGGRNHLFEIHNSDVYDNGEYVIRVRTKYNMSDLNLNLTINVQPIPKITPNVEYVAPGQSMNFFCTTVSHPLANVTWRYMERPNYPSLDGNRSVTLSDYKELPNINAVTSESQLNIKINCTGHLICRSCNYINCVEVSKLIYVSDVNASFAIKPLESVVEGDNINITCGASVYLNFSSDEILKWNVNRSDLETGRMRVLEEKTKFTHLSILQISGVTRLDDGIYICDVLDKSKGFKPQAYNLSVAAGRKPKIYEWNMNTSQLVIDTDKKRKDGVTLKCLSDGMPKPETTWLKNNKPLPEAHSYHISKSKSEFRIYSFIEQDSGLYTCQMVNRFGIDQRSVDIVVRGQSYTLWISLIGVLLIIIAVIVIYLVIDVKRQRRLKRELHAAGLTHFAEGAIECLNPDLNIDDQAELLPYDKKWEFPWERLKLGKQLGSGAFGVVMKAEAQGICAEGEVTTVAVKMVRRSADPSYMKALASELKIMAHLGQHLNVVNLLGACTKNIITKRELYVIVEYCRFGNLHNYLQRHRDSFINQIDPSTKKIDASIGIELLARRDSVVEQKRRPSRTFSRSVSVRSTETNSGAELIDYHENTDFADINMSPDGGILSNNSVQPGWRSNYRGDYKDQNLKPICTHDLLCWAWQVSRGMEYLSRRNVLHGDLAARNILLTDDNLVKICDFGLAKNMYKDDNYQKKGDSPLPIKWMAIESIRDRLFSTQSDIWSFGIVLWEFFTLAQTPYPGMDAEKQYHRLIEGYRMDKPEYATSEIYDFMQECWNAKPSLRPTFSELVNKLGDLLNESIRMHYSEQDDVYIEMNKRNLKDGQSDYLTMMSPSNRDVHDLAVQMMEPPPSSDYLPMSPMKTTKDPDIFSPRTKDCETHFDFPPTSNTAPINSNSEDSTESTPTQLSENSREEKTGEDPQEKRAESGKKELENSIIATDANYCNVVNNRPVSIPKNHFQDEVKDSYTNLMQSNIGNNYINFSAKLTNPDHRVNISQQKNNEAKNVFDSFSNPSYISIPQP